MSQEKSDKKKTGEESAGKKIDRRDFIQGLATVPVLGVFGATLAGKIASDKKSASAAVPKIIPGGDVSDINIALLGAGAEGQVLLNACLKIPGIRFKAVCDIWTGYNQKRASRILQKYKHEVIPYVSDSLSVSRADAVADYLAEKNIHPRRVRGYGEKLPVANNESMLGRYTNRRVEIWII